MPSNHLVLCYPLLFLPSIFTSIKVSFSISPSNEYSGLIFFRTDWFDLPAVQGTLKSLPSTTARKHQFFGAQPEEGGEGLII